MAPSRFILPATLRLPHPWLTTYRVRQAEDTKGNEKQLLQICHEPRELDNCSVRGDGQPLHEQLHGSICFSNPLNEQSDEDMISENVNTFLARVRRSPKSQWKWSENAAPTLAQAWLVTYALFSLRPELEHFRLQLMGKDNGRLADELQRVALAVEHPSLEDGRPGYQSELVLLRSTFWQGAGSPFGTRPVWAPETHILASTGRELATYPATPLQYTTTTRFPEVAIHSLHPKRAAKPRPGSVIYSRYIPHLDEHFSMVALDYQTEEHLNLFHAWQNDPRVAAGWNETGTKDQHREYLRRLHEDPHVLTVLAKFDDSYFGYFEFYWAKEDHIGAFCEPDDFDRGRHIMVGDVRFRGIHRVSVWFVAISHYLFLDEPRTGNVVGEPKASNGTVVSYDLLYGVGIQKLIDLPHKRSAYVKGSRERFFQLCPFHYSEAEKRVVAGTQVGLTSKL